MSKERWRRRLKPLGGAPNIRLAPSPEGPTLTGTVGHSNSCKNHGHLFFTPLPLDHPRSFPGWTAQDGMYSLCSGLHTGQRKSGSSSSELLAPEEASNAEDR
eukprot:774217-Pelagomonas_calceolata.AAC.7